MLILTGKGRLPAQEVLGYEEYVLIEHYENEK